MYEVSKEELLEEIARANEDEQEAIAKYAHLLDVIRHVAACCRHDKISVLNHLYADVEEYIAEELKHAKGLTEHFCEISDIAPEK